jgi:hypothetical protein
MQSRVVLAVQSRGGWDGPTPVWILPFYGSYFRLTLTWSLMTFSACSLLSNYLPPREPLRDPYLEYSQLHPASELSERRLPDDICLMDRGIKGLHFKQGSWDCPSWCGQIRHQSEDLSSLFNVILHASYQLSSLPQANGYMRFGAARKSMPPGY